MITSEPIFLTVESEARLYLRKSRSSAISVRCLYPMAPEQRVRPCQAPYGTIKYDTWQIIIGTLKCLLSPRQTSLSCNDE